MGSLGEIKRKKTQCYWRYLHVWAALSSVDAVQLCLFGFVHFPSTQSSPFSPTIRKLTPNLGINRSYSITNHKKYKKGINS